MATHNGSPFYPDSDEVASIASDIATLVAATSAAMSAMVVTDMLDGALLFVTSRDAVFRLQTSAAVTNTWDTFASATAGRQWVRQVHISQKSAVIAAWTVNTATGDDDAAGTGGAPLLTLQELSWRLQHARFTQSVTVAVTGSMVASDTPIFTFRVGGAGNTFTITFIPVLVYASTITAVPGVAAAGPGITENTITDAAVPTGTFTGAGALANGVMGRRTGGTAFWWFAKDNGATVARISNPSAALANGNAYEVVTLPTMNVMRFLETRFNAVVIQQGFNSGGTWCDSSLRFERCWLDACSLPAVVHSNSALSGGGSINVQATARNLQFLVGGMFRGTGATSFLMFELNVLVSGRLTLQAAVFQLQGGFAIISNTDLLVYDCTGANGAIQAITCGHIIWSGGAIVGTGTTTFLMYVATRSSIAHLTNPVAVAGSSTNATPIQVNGTGALTVAQETAAVGVVNLQGNGIFPTT